MISFDNTEIAYYNKTDKELRRSRILFRLIATPKIVSINKKILNIISFFKLPVDWILRPTVYKQFVGGVDFNDCLPYVRKLAQQGVKSVLQLSLENDLRDPDYSIIYQELRKGIENSKNNPDIPFNVLKPSNLISKCTLTHLSEGKTLTPQELREYENFKKRMDDICALSANVQKPILVDSEESWCQPPVDDLLVEMMGKYNTSNCIVYTTLQMYRTDRLQYLFNLHKLAKEKGFFVGIKLVRGAYMEKERLRAEKMGYTSPIHETKADTERDFNEAIKYIVYNIETISLFCGTHNEDSVNYLACLMDSYNIESNDQRVYFSQLYGMSDNISFNLAMNDYNVAKLIPYGPVKKVLSYLIRRAEENTAVQGQTGRDLKMISIELKRRKVAKRSIN